MAKLVGNREYGHLSMDCGPCKRGLRLGDKGLRGFDLLVTEA